MGYLIETTRLRMRLFVEADDVFIHQLLNAPTWLQFIGDRKIKTMADARAYLYSGPFSSYRTHGYGPWLVELKDDQTPIGMCGFFKRGFLPGPDAGFAFLPAFEGLGYAYEALIATLAYAQEMYSVTELFAITLHENIRCKRLLEKAGFQYKEMIHPPGEEQPLMLFRNELDVTRMPTEI